MQIAVRSLLSAGTATFVAAGALALTPVLPAVPAGVPAPATADVALSALSLSLTDVVGLLQGLGIGGVVPDFLTALPSLLPTDLVTAVVTEFVNQASPLVLIAAGEVFDYLGAAVAGLVSGPESIPARFGDALAAVPATLVSALGSLGAGDLPTAVQLVADVLAGPAAGITAALTDATADFQEYVTGQFTGLLTALPGVLLAAVQTVVTDSLQSLIDSIGGAFSGLLGGLVPAPGGAVAAAAAVSPAAPAVPDAVVPGAGLPAAVVPADPSDGPGAPALAPGRTSAATVSSSGRHRGAALSRPAAAESASAGRPESAKAGPDTGKGRAGRASAATAR